MKTVSDPIIARSFPNHRSLVVEIVALKERGEIDGYSIQKHPVIGYSAGVRVGETWGYLGK